MCCVSLLILFLAYPSSPVNLTLTVVPTNTSACLLAAWSPPSFLGSPLSDIVYPF
jgi:hypothetical protein